MKSIDIHYLDPISAEANEFKNELNYEQWWNDIQPLFDCFDTDTNQTDGLSDQFISQCFL